MGRSCLGLRCSSSDLEEVSGEDLAILDDDSAVAEDEVHSAGDTAFALELPEGVGVECALIAEDAAAVECR